MKYKSSKIIIGAGLMLLLPAFVNGQKRGVSENQFQYKAQVEALTEGVHWYYNWGNKEGENVEGIMEYVPMCWGSSYSADNIRNYCKNHPETKYLLGFNEPNFKAQSNMTPQQAAEAWPAVQALAKECGLQIVAPALNYSPDAPYTDPLKWMDEFVALVGKDAFDFTAIHSYGGFNVMADLATKFHDRYGKDVWVTEFCYWPNEGDSNSTVSPESQIGVMMQSLEWLEKTEWIYRYSWFKAIGNSSASKGPNYGLLISGKGEEPRELSEQGYVYTYMPTFDPEKYNAINTIVPASEYWAQTSALLGKSYDEECGSPIEISRFNAGAILDYKFDVPADGDYTLTLKVSGQGEPVRFDPTIGIFAVNADNTDGEVLSAAYQFDLPGDNETYKEVKYQMNLKAGKQTIRVKDTAPYSPSGIRISSLTLSDGNAVVEKISDYNADSLVDVFNLQGVMLRHSIKASEAGVGLPEGIYIIGGNKVIIK